MRLELHLNGSHFTHQDIVLPDYGDVEFETKCELREKFVAYQKEVLRINYLRQILKCNGAYQIYLIVKSGNYDGG